MSPAYRVAARRRRSSPDRERQLEFDELTIHEKVKARVCQATSPGGRCACWDGSERRQRPRCFSLDNVVNRIVDDVRRDVHRRIEEGKGS